MTILKSMPFTRKMMMANYPDAVEIAKAGMRMSVHYNADGETPFHVLASLVSSPRLFEAFWKDVEPDSFVEAGDTFLEKHTMLTDNLQKTYAISLAEWHKISSKYTDVEQYELNDASISRIQIWPYDPRTLSFEQMVLSVGMSFTDAELQEEPRLCGALRDLMKEFRVEYYWEPRRYG
ncbi:hypothetical protein [Pseudomonas qingdaonensis]|uniref:hypothetical protein n=1 Tax=Pseudomonas qingdaonensis TaxID=2056231 RepID=UPI002E178F22|nr:hypothetical protein [Pseudomonas qingdaonensis]